MPAHRLPGVTERNCETSGRATCEKRETFMTWYSHVRVDSRGSPKTTFTANWPDTRLKSVVQVFNASIVKDKVGLDVSSRPRVKMLASSNSNRNFYKHLTKCHVCPQSTKTMLRQLFKERQERGKREAKGNRTLFLQLVWDRMHGVHGDST